MLPMYPRPMTPAEMPPIYYGGLAPAPTHLHSSSHDAPVMALSTRPTPPISLKSGPCVGLLEPPRAPHADCTVLATRSPRRGWPAVAARVASAMAAV